MADATGAVTAPVGAVLSTRRLVITADVNVLPDLSVVTARRSYRPSAVPVVVVHVTAYGAVVAVTPWLVQVLVPAGDRWYCTELTPLPPSAELAVMLIAPRRMPLLVGAVTLPVGAVLSTRTFAIVADVNVFPTLSVVITRKSYRPSVEVVVSHVVAYGDVVSATPRFDHEPAPAGETWNCADATPDDASAELDVTLTAVPRTFALATGAVTEPVGAVASAVNVNVLVAVFPAASATVTVYVPGADAPDVHENTLDVNGPPTGADTTSAACVHPAVDWIGNDACTGPDPASVTVATARYEPAAFDLKYDATRAQGRARRARCERQAHRGRGVVDPHVGDDG